MIVAVVMATAWPVDVAAIISFDLGLQIFATDDPISDFRLREQEIDHLIFEQRSAKLGGRHGFLANIFGELLAIGRPVLLRRLRDQLIHFLGRHLDAVGVADLRQEKTQPHAPFGDRAIILAFRFHFGARGFGIGLVARLMLELLPDLIELGLHHRSGDREVVRRGELIEELALHVGAGEAVQLLLDLATNELAELVDSLEPHRLGESVVGLCLARLLHFVDGDLEGGGAAFQIIGVVIFGERDVERALLVRLGADQLVFKARYEPAGADLDRHALALPAFERLSIDLALIVHDDEVALLSGVVGGCGIIALLPLRELLQPLVHLGVGGFGSETLELQALDLRRRDIGKGFHLNRDNGVLAGFAALLQVDRRLHRRAKPLLGHQLLDTFLNRSFKGLLLQGRSVHLSNEIRRNLAGAEPGHPHLRRNPLHLTIDTGIDVPCGDGDLVSAPEALVQRLDSLHFEAKPSLCRSFVVRHFA